MRRCRAICCPCHSRGHREQGVQDAVGRCQRTVLCRTALQPYTVPCSPSASHDTAHVTTRSRATERNIPPAALAQLQRCLPGGRVQQDSCTSRPAVLALAPGGPWRVLIDMCLPPTRPLTRRTPWPCLTRSRPRSRPSRWQVRGRTIKGSGVVKGLAPHRAVGGRDGTPPWGHLASTAGVARGASSVAAETD